MAPDACVVAGYSAAQMPALDLELFTQQEIADIMAYLLTLEY